MRNVLAGAHKYPANTFSIRHPLQELYVAPFVANDTHVEKEKSRMKILTGPNASGKSVYLKQVMHYVHGRLYIMIENEWKYFMQLFLLVPRLDCIFSYFLVAQENKIFFYPWLCIGSRVAILLTT